MESSAAYVMGSPWGQPGNSDPGDISGNLGTFGSAYDGIFHPWNYRIDLCGNKKKKERTCFSFLSISDSGISAWGMYRRNLRWRKESKGG